MAVVDVNWVLGMISSDRRDVKRRERESKLTAVYMILLSLFWFLCCNKGRISVLLILISNQPFFDLAKCSLVIFSLVELINKLVNHPFV